MSFVDPRSRLCHTQKPLLESDVDANPLRQFERWFDEAVKAGVLEPEAMALATATTGGAPSARMVLLRDFDERGFVFFTNYDSRKARELAANPRAALVFFWEAVERQIRVEGRIETVSAAESDAYFAGRPRGSQLGAWASPQSDVLTSREALEQRVRDVETRFADDKPVPRPPNWGGLRVVPDLIEFWQGEPSRLHDRLCFQRQADGTWLMQRLAP
jgi:pyridoxamine 5'-phosphate oxidase